MSSLTVEMADPTVGKPILTLGMPTLRLGKLDQVSDGRISIKSPFIKVNPASLTLATGINYEYPLISFNVEISPDVPLGDYSIRLQSKSGEVAYIPGGLTADSAFGALADERES
jgi:hypothetical protein